MRSTLSVRGTMAHLPWWADGVEDPCVSLNRILSKQRGQERKQTQGVLHAFLTRNLKEIQT